jgi:hypothetical protein
MLQRLIFILNSDNTGEQDETNRTGHFCNTLLPFIRW